MILQERGGKGCIFSTGKGEELPSRGGGDEIPGGVFSSLPFLSLFLWRRGRER
jgi:hypothetical protein